MAENQDSNVPAGLTADSDSVIPRIKLGEQGFVGLKVYGRNIYDDANRAFQYPGYFKVVSELRYDPTIAAALNVYKMLISRVKWTVTPPEGATEQQIARAKFVQQCMTDMDMSWSSFINEVLTYLEYGHSIHEKVFRRRLRKNGSRYNDGLVGIKKLAPRAQDTIRYWYFSDDGRDLVAVGQSLTNLENGYRYNDMLQTNEDGVIKIDRQKFLLFTADSTKNNPQGNSILKHVYLAYKRMHLLQEQELVSVTKEATGLPVIQIPPKYMDPNASPEDKLVYEMCKKIIDNLANGTQRGIVFPKMTDPESKADLFKIDLLSHRGTASFDLNGIIKRYQNDILVALCADVVAMGTGEGGSYSLASEKSNLLSLAISHRLNEITEVLNNDLVPQLFSMNGWLDEELPKFVPGDLEEVSMEEWSKFAQRVASTGLLELDRDVLNKVREVGGIKTLPDNTPIDYDNLTTNVSNSGKGMEVGRSGSGTAKIGSDADKKDASVANSENKG